MNFASATEHDEIMERFPPSLTQVSMQAQDTPKQVPGFSVFSLPAGDEGTPCLCILKQALFSLAAHAFTLCILVWLCRSDGPKNKKPISQTS